MISPEIVASPFILIERLFAIRIPSKMELPPSEILWPVPTTLNKTWFHCSPAKSMCELPFNENLLLTLMINVVVAVPSRVKELFPLRIKFFRLSTTVSPSAPVIVGVKLKA